MATWKDLDWREKWSIIDHVLTIVGQRVNEREVAYDKALRANYNIATEARYSEAGAIISIIQGMKNSLDALEKKLNEQL